MAYQSASSAPSAPSMGQGQSQGQGRKTFTRRKKSCPLSGAKAPAVDYKDVRMLQRYTSERGKIMPSRITAISTKKQRLLAKAVKRARVLALMPYVSN